MLEPDSHGEAELIEAVALHEADAERFALSTPAQAALGQLIGGFAAIYRERVPSASAIRTRLESIERRPADAALDELHAVEFGLLQRASWLEFRSVRPESLDLERLARTAHKALSLLPGSAGAGRPSTADLDRSLVDGLVAFLTRVRAPERPTVEASLEFVGAACARINEALSGGPGRAPGPQSSRLPQLLRAARRKLAP